MARVLVCLAALVAVCPVRAEVAVATRVGRIEALRAAGRYMAVTADLRVPVRGWGRVPGWAEARNVTTTREGGARSWVGTVEPTPGKPFRLEQTLREAGETAILDLKVTAESDAEIEGVYFWLDVPIADFKGGTAVLSAAGAQAGKVVLPVQRPPSRHFLSGAGERLSLQSAAGRSSLAVTCSRSLPVVVQDTREWQGSTYSAFFELARSLRRGESTTLTVTLAPATHGDEKPARLTLDARQRRYRLDGFGGDYCFNIESPVTQYTLANLRVAWARTEMSLSLWEPRPGMAAGEDTPASRIRREFELMRQIQGKGIPYAISIWRAPEWLYADPGSGKDGHRVVPRDKWPALAACVARYLVHAKKQYGVEPSLFSFNEPDWGVQVYLSPQDHRDLIKVLGAEFKRQGLRTRMLLADVTNPRGTAAYAEPTAADPEAMRYVGAIAFHSWGGGSAADYRAWRDLARRLKLPLLVTELGVDAGAWQTAAYDSYSYALREMQMYQELLLDACPQGTMQWEFTADYSTVQVERDAAGSTRIVPTARFWLVKQFCNLTPPRADALATASDTPDVLFTAFAGGAAGRRSYALHIVNGGGRRTATLVGIPAGVSRLRAVRTSETEGFAEAGTVAVRGGRASLALEPSSMVTLVGTGR